LSIEGYRLTVLLNAVMFGTLAVAASGDRCEEAPIDFHLLLGVEAGEKPGEESAPPHHAPPPPPVLLPPGLVCVGILRFFLLFVFSVHS